MKRYMEFHNIEFHSAIHQNKMNFLAAESRTIPYGDLLGACREIEAYSNGDPDRISLEWNVDSKGRVCGIKWQCVEYVRRYLHEVEGSTFHDVDSAHNIWDLDVLTNFETGAMHEFFSIKNGAAKEPPTESSLLIYPIQPNCPYGHVAVITHVKFDEKSGRGHVQVSEQNWTNSSWKGYDYSRLLELLRDDQGCYTIIDDNQYSILGWKTLGKMTLP